MNIASDLAAIFRRDLARLDQEIRAFPSEESLWQTLPGVSNSAGNLALHLEGNLREFVGRQLGSVPYQRQRPLEFSLKYVPQAELLARIADLGRTVPYVVEALTPQQLETDYPQDIIGIVPTGQFLIHLYGHLSWHLGQIDYLRRVLTGEGAITPASL